MTNIAVGFSDDNRVIVSECAMPALGPSDVLIQTTRSLVSAGTELTALNRDVPGSSIWAKVAARCREAQSTGYSNVGRVVEIGSQVPSDLLGRRVVSGSRHAAFVSRSSSEVFPIPDPVSDDEATFAFLFMIAIHAVRLSNVRLGESVAVVGLGILGQLTVRLCAMAGTRPIIGINRTSARLRWLPQVPYCHGFAADPLEVREQVEALTSGRLLDVVFEASGDPLVIAKETALVRNMGRLVILSSPRGPSVFDFHDACNFGSLSIIGAHAGSHPRLATAADPWTVQRHGELFLEWVARGDFVVRDLVSHHFAGADAASAYALLDARTEPTMGVILDWS